MRQKNIVCAMVDVRHIAAHVIERLDDILVDVDFVLFFAYIRDICGHRTSVKMYMGFPLACRHGSRCGDQHGSRMVWGSGGLVEAWTGVVERAFGAEFGFDFIKSVRQLGPRDVCVCVFGCFIFSCGMVL